MEAVAIRPPRTRARRAEPRRPWRGARGGAAALLLALGSGAVLTAAQPNDTICGTQPMELRRIRGSAARCNDGSDPGYWFRPGDPKFVFVWLQGGFACSSKETCDARSVDKWANAKGLMTGRSLHPEMFRCGVFASTYEFDKVFATATLVVAHYCSSDSWTGDRDEPVDGRFFQGQRILTALIQEISAKHDLGAAETVVFGGCSAGGRGGLYNLDRLCGLLPNPSTRCRGYFEASWWVQPERSASLANTAREGYAYWNASSLLADCARNRPPDSAHLCFFGPVLAPHVKTPYFLRAELWDSFQLSHHGIDESDFWWTPSQWATGAAQRDAIRDSLLALPAGNGAYATACYGHCSSEWNYIWSERLSTGDRTPKMADALNDWLRGTPGRHVYVEECNDINCSYHCSFIRWNPWWTVAVYLSIFCSIVLVLAFAYYAARSSRRERLKLLEPSDGTCSEYSE
eukprot:TRINITY_DN245_c0_g3_i1.p1 TRINITY_DN245_c0_g3~~TRINITY_DN245_c0_g3_i1.p1  ORF type:complete len:480 (+),score=49.03 TRINITY_DN245_c0_g3_i1:66-1442(+)